MFPSFTQTISPSRNAPKEPQHNHNEDRVEHYHSVAASQHDSSPKIKLDLIHYKNQLVSICWPWSLTLSTYAGRRQSLYLLKAIISWKGIQPPLTVSVSGCLLRANTGQVTQIKAVEMESSSPHPLPSSWGTQAGNFLISNLGSVQKERRERCIPGGSNAACWRAHQSIQAFRVNLPSLWSFFFFNTLKTFLHNHFFPRASKHRSCVHNPVSHASKGLELPGKNHVWEGSDFRNLGQVVSADTS